jgi:PAS domain S-box-containing protein
MTRRAALDVIRWRAGLTVVLALLGLMAGVVLVSVRAREAQTAQQLVDHTIDVLTVMGRFDAALADAVAGQRGWQLARGNTMLQLYDRGARRSWTAIDSARALTRDNAVQQARLDTLVALRAELVARLRARLPRDAPPDAGGVVAVEDGVRSEPDSVLVRRERTRNLTARMVRTERNLLESRALHVHEILGEISVIATGAVAYAAIVAAVAMLLLIRDIRRRVEAERTARATSRQFRAIFDSSTEAIFLLDPDGVVIGANAAAASDLGATTPKTIGKRLWECDWFTEVGGVPDRAAGAVAAAARGDAPRFEATLTIRGAPRTYIIAFARVLQDNGALSMLVLELVDITVRRELERVKEQFIALASHEIRTPLGALRGSLRLLERGGNGLSTGERDLLALAARNAERLLTLVNALLDLEKLEAGKDSIERVPVSLGSLLRESAEVLGALADQARVTLVVEADDIVIDADAPRLQQVIVNLAGNAIKFSPEGGRVTLHARRTSAGDRAVIEVRDQGRGVPPEQRARIFERFAQVERADAKEKGGTGLGLAIALAIVRAHDGGIDVDDAPEGGTIFRVTLPTTA